MAPRSIFVLGTATLVLAGFAEAGQTYYVSASGSDANAGTSSDKPLGSIAKGLSLAQPGDTVNLLPGTYRDQSASFVRSGTAALPITLQAVPGSADGSVVIKGSDVLTGWTRQGATDVYTHPNFNYYFGSWSATPNDARDKARNQLFVDGQYVQEVATQSALVPGSFYVDKTNKSVSVRLTGGANPASKTVEASVTSGALLATNGFDNLVVRGLSFAHDANAPQDFAAVQVRGGSDNVVVDNVSVTYAAGAGISVDDGNNNTIKNSHFNYNGQQGIHSANTTNLLVKNSETSYNNTLAGKQYDPGWEAGGNKFVRSKNAVVDGLVSHHNVGSGIWFDVDNRDATIKNSISHDNGKGIHYEISWRGKIFNNLVYHNTYDRDTLNFDGTKLEPSSPSAYGIFVSSSAGVQVYNNTVVGNDRSGISVTGPLRDDGDGNKVYSYGADLKNNLVAMNAAYTGAIKPNSTRDPFEYQIYNGGPNATVDPSLGANPVVPFSGNMSNHNLFQIRASGATQTVNSFGFNSWNDQTLAGWRNHSGQDASGWVTDPLFVNASKDDYRLQPTSPALGKGFLMSDIPGSENIGVNFSLLPTSTLPEPGVVAFSIAGLLPAAAMRRRSRQRASSFEN